MFKEELDKLDFEIGKLKKSRLQKIKEFQASCPHPNTYRYTGISISLTHLMELREVCQECGLGYRLEDSLGGEPSPFQNSKSFIPIESSIELRRYEVND